ncbi:unnamed protein product [Nyctereutes procyonoides]|uniref:(raccoon dog) hypothetical protein n=1 Tax=Nyctereutes procyonoides TaxID=34880 RepID=A0A811ZQL0_NYCPR|nr:unnamed protein product [Nyctereutes procyonoides]
MSMACCRVAASGWWDLQVKHLSYLQNLFSNGANILLWHALLLPDKIGLSVQTPSVTFTTRIYHPNVGNSGEVCDDNWNGLVNRPDLGQAVCMELADPLR